jgi:hypothetical protein
MSYINPSLCLQIYINSSGNGYFDNQFICNIQASTNNNQNIQPIQAGTNNYTILDIKPGFWLSGGVISNNQTAQAWRVISIDNINPDGSIDITLEDVQYYNYSISQIYLGYTYPQSNSIAYCWQLGDNGLPNLSPITQDLVSAGLDYEYITNLTNRFNSFNNYTKYINVCQVPVTPVINTVGQFLYIDINTGLFQVVTSNTSSSIIIIGVVTSVGIPDPQCVNSSFTYAPFGQYIPGANITPSLMGTVGQIYYLDTSGNVVSSPPTSYPVYIQVSAPANGVGGDAILLKNNMQSGNSVTGDTGVSGVTGDTGVSGVTGDTGVSGVTGDTGVSGVTGDTGVSGVTGDTGVSGVTGDTGVSGVTGDTGVSGVTGDTGVSGVTGETGVSGVTGETGISGVTGETGISGVTGETGV